MDTLECFLSFTMVLCVDMFSLKRELVVITVLTAEYSLASNKLAALKADPFTWLPPGL